jgi:rare lipoprotein A
VVKVNDRGPFKKDRLIDLSYAAAYKLRLVDKGSGRVVVEWLDPGKPQEVASTPAPTQVATAGSYVQLGAFKQKENADALRQQLEQQGLSQGAAVESWYNADLYRVRVGPFPSRDQAERVAENIRQTLGVSAIITAQ